jgi:hypothetical protein
MKTKKTTVPATEGTACVDAFMADLDHPLKDDIDVVRRVIRDASPSIQEAIKWNAPSFRTREFFATIHLRTRDKIQIVFHLGAKARDDVQSMTIADPDGLIKWLAKDRCLVTLRNVSVEGHALGEIVRQWIEYG